MMMKNVNVNENVSVKGAKSVKVWSPNENQSKFLAVLADYKEPVSLMEIEVDKGVRFASGVVNPLVKKGLVIASDLDIECDIVFKGAVVGHKVNHVKGYMLAAIVAEEPAAE